MQIINAQIKNYKSLRKVEIDEFGSLTILIGRNSSGKSNFLEALYLFFNEFDSAPERDVGGVPEYLWFNSESGNPIEFVVAVRLNKREYNQIFPKELSSVAAFQEGILTVRREILSKPPNTATWRTTHIALDETPIIDKGKWQASIAAAAIRTNFMSNLSQSFKETFKLILAVRNNLGGLPTLVQRTASIIPQIQSNLVSTEQSDKRPDVRVWDEIERNLGEIQSLRNLRVRGGQMRSKQGYVYFPLPFIGGGDQEILALTFMLKREKARIFAIEEPETHLHPDLSRRLFNILKEISEKKQLILSTHSPIFIDTLNLKNAWIFRKDGMETKIYRIQHAEDLRIINYELGIRPSDIFFADRILFVEGAIDKIVYRIWAEKQKIDLTSPNVSVIPLRGKSKGKRHLKAWTEVTANIPVSIYMILDKDAKDEVAGLVESGFIKRSQISVLRKGAIEDYYDSDALMGVMIGRYGEEFTRDKLKPSQSKGLMRFLKSKHADWKTVWRAKAEIAQEVATKTPKAKINDEIVRMLERTEEYLAL